MTKIYSMTIRGFITVPDGTLLKYRKFLLPNGQWIKPWITMELNDDHDVSAQEAEDLGIDLEHDTVQFELLDDEGYSCSCGFDTSDPLTYDQHVAQCSGKPGP